nr:hypothetical protein CFP56_35653 [Quercus suber]
MALSHWRAEILGFTLTEFTHVLTSRYWAPQSKKYTDKEAHTSPYLYQIPFSLFLKPISNSIPSLSLRSSQVAIHSLSSFNSVWASPKLDICYRTLDSVKKDSDETMMSSS